MLVLYPEEPMQRKIGRVENYTNTCLVLWLVNLIWVFILIWTIWGLPAVMLVALALNGLISRSEHRRRTP